MEARTRTGGRWRTALDVTATGAMIVAAGVLVWSATRRPASAAQPVPVPKIPVALAGVPILGRPTAPLVIVEFSDFQCPFCGRFVKDTLPELKAKYIDTGQVALAFRNLPLPIHQYAERAAESAECAKAQGRFWPMHDALFGLASALDDTSLTKAAAGANLDEATFHACMDAAHGGAPQGITGDIALARSLGVTGTPTFLIGLRTASTDVRARQVLKGAQPIGTFEKAIEGLLKESSAYPVKGA